MLSLLVFGRSSKITYRTKKRNYFYFPILFSMCVLYIFIYIDIKYLSGEDERFPRIAITNSSFNIQRVEVLQHLGTN